MLLVNECENEHEREESFILPKDEMVKAVTIFIFFYFFLLIRGMSVGGGWNEKKEAF